MSKLDGFRDRDFLEQITILGEISGAASPDDLPALVDLFEKPLGDPTIDSMVVNAINAVFDAHPETVIKGLSSACPDMRTLSVRAAGESRVARATPILMEMAGATTSSDDRLDIMTALAQIADRQALPLFRRFLASGESLLAAVCIEACGRLGDTESIPVLLKIISDNEAEGRFEQCDITTWKAVGALAQMGTYEAVEALTAVLHHKNPTARRIISDAVVALGEKSVPHLLRLFETGTTDQRILVANLLGFIGERSGADGLVDAFDRGLAQDANVRYALYEALGRIGTMKGVVCLMDGLREEDELILMAVVTALDRQVNPALVRQVIPAFSHGDAQSRRLARALTASKAMRLFAELYKDKNVGNLIITTLTATKDETVVDTFAAVLSDMTGDEERIKADMARLPRVSPPGRIALIADDSKSMLALQRAILTDMGYTPTLAADGAEALAAAVENHFELVVTDMNMPAMDGMELVQELRALDAYANVPIVMVTTESEASQRNLAEESGVNAFITKPFKPEDLRKVILEITGG